MVWYFIDAHGRYVITSGKIVRKYKMLFRETHETQRGFFYLYTFFPFSKIIHHQNATPMTWIINHSVF